MLQNGPKKTKAFHTESFLTCDCDCYNCSKKLCGKFHDISLEKEEHDSIRVRNITI